MAKFCLGCLNPLPDGDDTCRVCGYTSADQNPSIALPIETVLQDHYVVGRMVHEAGDSLFYLGYDKTLGEPCFIQEYYPGGVCSRMEDGTLLPLGGCEAVYAEYQQEFSKTMRSLARVKDLPCIIPIYDIFEQNGTVYTVSDYLTGETLAGKLKRVGRIPWQEARSLFMPLMTCLEQLTSIGISHNAICPANILIADDGKLYLRGFSLAATRQVGHDLTPRLATGYAAPEQYTNDADLTEATDVYGVAATIFRTVTGTVPPAGNNRAEDSDDLFMTADIAEELTQQVCVALFNALQVHADTRTATAKQLHQQIAMEPNVSALLDEDKPTPPKKPKTGLTLFIIFASVAAALLVAVGIIFFLLREDTKQPSSEPPVSLPHYTTTTTTATPTAKYSAPNLLGSNYYDVLNKEYDGDFNIVVKYKEYSEKKADLIISQEPASGELLEKGATISIVVSLGKDDFITVPDVHEWEEEHAKLYLEALGFRVNIAELYVSDVSRGLVDSTDPQAGATKKRGDTITLRVSYVVPSDGIPSGGGDVSDVNNTVDVGDIFPE